MERLRHLQAVTLGLLVAFVVFFGGGEGTSWTNDLHDPYCAPFQGAEIPRCANILGYPEGLPIFIAGDVSWEFLVGRVRSLQNVIISNSDGPVLPECRLAGTKISCATHFRPCARNSLNETVAWPVQPCIDLCTDLLHHCGNIQEGSVLSSASVAFLPEKEMLRNFSCDITDLYANHTRFFPNDDHYNISSPLYGDLLLQCSAPKVGVLEFSCQEPLVNDDDGNGCAFECPLPTFSEEEYEDVKLAQAVFAWLSLVTTSVMGVTFFLSPTLRKFPANLVVMVAISANIASGGLCLATMIGEEQVWCGDEVYAFGATVSSATTEVKDADSLFVKNPLCTFQGFLLMFGILGATFWWFVIAINMVIHLWLNELLPKKWKENLNIKLQILFHSLAWGLSALFAFIPAVADKIVFASGDTFCFVSVDEGGEVFFWLFWAAPMSICLLLGTLSFLFCIIKITTVIIQTGRTELLKSNLRVGCFVLVFLLVYSFIFAHSIRVQTSKEEVEQGYADYLACLYFPAQFGKENKDQCHLEEDVSNYPLVFLRAIGVSSLGWLVFCTFVSKDWWAVYRNTLSTSTSLPNQAARHRSSTNTHNNSIQKTKRKKRRDKKAIALGVTAVEDVEEEVDKEEEEQEEEEDKENKEG
ncbi:hypothetical protein QOT17_011733 [Balamuthia mandrillaris]